MQNPPESPEAPAKLWSRKKIALWFFGVDGGLFLGLAIALLAYDEKLQPYDDLKPTRTETPDARTNGYLFLRERWENPASGNKNDLDKIKELIRGQIPWDESFKASVQVESEKAAADLKEALALPEYLTPSGLNFKDPDLNRYAWLTKPFKYSWLEVIGRCRARENAAAVSLLDIMHSLSVRHIEGSSSLFSLLVGVTLHQMTAELTGEMLDLGEFEPAELAKLAELWNKDLRAGETWRKAMQDEAALMADFIAVMKKNPDDIPETMRVRFAPLLLKPNLTMNRLHDQFRLASEIAFQTFPSLAVASAAGWSDLKDNRTKFTKYLDPNYAGSQLLYDTNILGKIQPGMRCSMLVYPRTMRVAVAIHQWRVSHPDQWPATLEELVPDYLSVVPQDPFNGLPLQWDQPSRTIYSVGADWKPDVPVFRPGQRWFSGDHASPGLRLTRDPASSVPVSK